MMILAAMTRSRSRGVQCLFGFTDRCSLNRLHENHQQVYTLQSIEKNNQPVFSQNLFRYVQIFSYYRQYQIQESKLGSRKSEALN